MTDFERVPDKKDEPIDDLISRLSTRADVEALSDEDLDDLIDDLCFDDDTSPNHCVSCYAWVVAQAREDADV